jgi:hypothetical protein
MVDIKIDDRELAQKFGQILRQQFDGDAEELIKWIIHYYEQDFRKADYSGILKWPEDATNYQRTIRNDWP